jgi:hypothetical protein
VPLGNPPDGGWPVFFHMRRPRKSKNHGIYTNLTRWGLSSIWIK